MSTQNIFLYFYFFLAFYYKFRKYFFEKILNSGKKNKIIKF
uniref:Uncharacterized protein n=1 Tax=viral metagenome TaxID=1070528 RepID=A0A6C0J700_9ZZZZ